ncbi:MAG: hypothetical protein ACFFEJ_18090 [Candidatus Thorarchaeota archaeon]
MLSILLLWPNVIIYGVIFVILYHTEFRKERKKGVYAPSYIFLLLWLCGTLFFFVSAYNAYIAVLAPDPWGVYISPSDEIIYWNTLWGLIPATIFLLILSISFAIDSILSKKIPTEQSPKPGW